MLGDATTVLESTLAGRHPIFVEIVGSKLLKIVILCYQLIPLNNKCETWYLYNYILFREHKTDPSIDKIYI